MRYLLDTHILVWWFAQSSRLTSRQQDVLDAASPDSPLLVSDISLWEIATLVSLGRIQFEIPLEQWLRRATAAPLVELYRITPKIADQVATLPDTFHRDPADRVIVSTAKVTGATLLTADQRIIESKLTETL